VILDAGFLSSIDRGERQARAFIAAADRAGTGLHTTHAVVAQVWRNGSRQARLSAFLEITVIHPLDDGRAVGRVLAHSKTSDIVDVHLVICAVRLGHDILTGDPDDIIALASVFGPAAPAVLSWP